MVGILKKTIYLVLCVILVCTLLVFVVFAGGGVLAGLETNEHILSLKQFFSGFKNSERTSYLRLPSTFSRSEEIAPEEIPLSSPFPFLPEFLYPELLEAADAPQAVVTLASGSYGNLWLVEKSGDKYYTSAGPLFCRLGKEGLTENKTDGDNKTPVGITRIGSLYGAKPPGSLSLPFTALTPGGVWVNDIFSVFYNRYFPPDGEGRDFASSRPLSASKDSYYLDIGHNPECIPGRGSGVLLCTGDTSVPTAGEITLSHKDMARVLEFLDEEKNPVMGVFRASEVSWKVETAMPPNFVYLSEAVPGALEDPAYAGEENFVGRPLGGYLGKRVVVSVNVANALSKAVKILKGQGLTVLVYDGYRPGRAVNDIFHWIADPNDIKRKEFHYPTLGKDELANVYLVQNSRHSYGAAVDLTLCDLHTGETLDMGTGFDFFSPLSNYYSRELTDEQRQNRKLLRDTMRAAGFSPYDEEWWHFNLDSAPLKTKYDFAIPQ